MNTGVPIMRLELEGMKHSILHAFSQMSVATDAMVQVEVEKFCQPERLQEIIAQEVGRVLKASIENEVRSFFSYGDGGTYIKELTKLAIASSLAPIPGERP